MDYAYNMTRNKILEMRQTFKKLSSSEDTEDWAKEFSSNLVRISCYHSTHNA
jgi:hypothetical protein